MLLKNEDKITLSFQPSKNFFGLLKRLSPFLGLIGIAFFINACAQRINENINRGSNYNFRSGYPEVRMSAIGLFDEQGNPGINLSADIVYGSLIYKEVEGEQTANITIETRIVRASGNNEVVINESYDQAVSADIPLISSSQEVFSFEKRYPVTAGTYTIYLTVVDQASGKNTRRQATTTIPEPDVQNPVLTEVQLLGKENQNPDYIPITTYDVPGKIDSLKFRFQVTPGEADRIITITSRLVRFESDTSYARSMALPGPSPSSVQFQGIDYSNPEVIQASQRVLNQTGSVLVEFNFPMQRRGNYRFSAQIENQDNVDETIFKARDFSIKSENYPTIKTPRELAQPLTYLMGDKEYKNLIKINDPDSLKQEIDRFWLRNIGNISRAKQVISLFYERVEEANKQFSNFKEGWKTDPGMIYILFGPPLFYEEDNDRMTWYYSYNRGDARETFMFEKPSFRSTYQFNHFILYRNIYYNSVENQQQELWLTGLILSRPN